MAIKIIEANTPERLKEFVYFNIELYKDSPYHVPGLVSDEMMTLSKEKNPAFEFCEAKYFMAYKDGVLAGRIAGIINHKANKIWNHDSVRFSFVDFIDDYDVSAALFKAVENWAKGKGMKIMQGPLGFTDLDHEGLLVYGFEELGTMATSYSYPYYMNHLEKLGFKKEQDWNEYEIKIPKETPERFRRVADIVAHKYKLKVKKFKKTRDIWPYATKIFEIWNEAYKPLYEYCELSPKQIEYYIKMYIPMLRLDLVTLVVKEEDESVVVGIGIGMPSLSKALKKANGKLLPTGWIYLLRAMYGNNNKLGDLYTIGVASEYQGKGVNAMIIDDMVFNFNKHGYIYAESNPELEINTKVQSQWELLEKRHHKTRRAFIKHL